MHQPLVNVVGSVSSPACMLISAPATHATIIMRHHTAKRQLLVYVLTALRHHDSSVSFVVQTADDDVHNKISGKTFCRFGSGARTHLYIDGDQASLRVYTRDSARSERSLSHQCPGDLR
ncbi:unnamed protein product [Ectocarpus sp. 6 AP-2014]